MDYRDFFWIVCGIGFAVAVVIGSIIGFFKNNMKFWIACSVGVAVAVLIGFIVGWIVESGIAMFCVTVGVAVVIINWIYQRNKMTK